MMLSALQVFWAVGHVAIAVVLIVGFVRTRNAGFVLLLVGLPISAAVWALVMPRLMPLAAELFPTRTLEYRMGLLQLIPSSVVLLINLTGFMLLALGGTSPRRVSHPSAHEQAPPVASS